MMMVIASAMIFGSISPSVTLDYPTAVVVPVKITREQQWPVRESKQRAEHENRFDCEPPDKNHPLGWGAKSFEFAKKGIVNGRCCVGI